jgi:hypothetical protein
MESIDLRKKKVEKPLLVDSNQNDEILHDILTEICLNNRQGMVKCIERNAGDEHETTQSVWKVAEQSKKVLRQTLKGIYEYYLNN